QALKTGATIKELQQIIDNHATQEHLTPLSPAGQTAEYQKMTADLADIKTVKQGQRLLNQIWGTKLPETGFWNGTWAKAYTNGQKNASTQYQYAQYMAKQEGFSTPEELLTAWNNKISAAKASGATEWIANALPMQVFSSGSGFF